MKKLIGRCLFAQSGGPTAVINSSMAGGILTALNSNCITGVLCANHGIQGVLQEDFFDMEKEDKKELKALKFTPASAFGSVRYKLKSPKENPSDYQKILEVFKKYDIRYFFYNGGNDSMDTCDKISKYMQSVGYEMRVLGIPKTIDNDLVGTDHCPGYASAAKYVATSISEINRDAVIYGNPLAIVVEIMGRNAGWLTASASLSSLNGYGADLIFLPEVPFSFDKFKKSVKKIVDKKKICIIAVSEGIKYKDGRLVGEDTTKLDAFGHTALGGVGSVLKSEIENMGIKCKAVELNILQRCASHISSKTDVDEAFNSGKYAVKKALKGETDKMVAFERKEGKKYKILYKSVPLTVCANAVKEVPKSMIGKDGVSLNENFISYALPLIQGEQKQRKKNGLNYFADLKLESFKIK